MLKKYFASALLGLGITQMYFQPNQLVANEESSEFPCCEATIVPGLPLDPCLVNNGYPYPATISLCDGWDIYARGEFIYWSMNNEAFRSLITEVTFNESSTLTKNLYLSDAYRPGFRVSLGADLGSVVLDVTYLRLHNHYSSTFFASAANSVIEPLIYYQIGIPIFWSSAKYTTQYNLDWALISLQKPVYMGKRVIMNLSYGIVAKWSGLNLDITGTALTVPPPIPFAILSDGFTSARSKIWAVGPNLGAKVIALLPMGFQALASVDLSLQYGVMYKHTATSSTAELDSAFFNNTFHSKHNPRIISATHGGEIGIGWGDYFGCDRYHIDLSLTYAINFEHVFLFSVPFSGVTGFDLYVPTSYSMHGIAVGGRIDF